MRRFVLKSMYPTIEDAKEIVLFNVFYVEVERGWVFFDSRKELEAWVDMMVLEKGAFFV